MAEFYSSGLLSGLILERGYDYAIGVSWTETDSAVSGSVTYGRDERQYPIPFLHGQVMGPDNPAKKTILTAWPVCHVWPATSSVIILLMLSSWILHL